MPETTPTPRPDDKPSEAKGVDLFSALRDLAAVAEAVNARQHAGLEIDGNAWSDLYARTNEAKAVVQAGAKQYTAIVDAARRCGEELRTIGERHGESLVDYSPVHALDKALRDARLAPTGRT